jgi:hypothetical protein
LIADRRAAEDAKRHTQELAREKAIERRQQMELKEWRKSPHAKPKDLVIQGDGGRGIVIPCPIQRRGKLENFKGIAFAELDCPQCPFCVKRTKTTVSCIGHFPKLALKDDQIVRQFGGSIRNEELLSTSPLGEQMSNREPDPF